MEFPETHVTSCAIRERAARRHHVVDPEAVRRKLRARGEPAVAFTTVVLERPHRRRRRRIRCAQHVDVSLRKLHLVAARELNSSGGSPDQRFPVHILINANIGHNRQLATS